MADEYIEKATAMCISEVSELKTGGVLLDERQYAWARR